MAYHDGMAFSTYDMDNDKYHGANCSTEFHGAFWYNDCFKYNANGRYDEYGDGEKEDMTQTDFTMYEAERTWKMMFRRS